MENKEHNYIIEYDITCAVGGIDYKGKCLICSKCYNVFYKFENDLLTNFFIELNNNLNCDEFIIKKLLE